MGMVSMMRQIVESATDKIVYDMDPETFLKQQVHHVAADEACTSGNYGEWRLVH
jgi:hypothetical protein